MSAMRVAAVLSGAVSALALIATTALAAGEDYHPVDPQNLWVLDTTKGRVMVELRPDIAPKHVERIRALTRKGFYDDDIFYRVMPHFMAQSGQKTFPADGASGMGTVKAEFSFTPATPVAPIAFGAGYSGDMAVLTTPDGKAIPRFCPGVASFAHYDDADSADAQFFLMTSRYPSLEGKFTAWGRVVAGQDVVTSFAQGFPPAQPDKITKARIAADMPVSERPQVSFADPASKDFQALIKKAKKEGGDGFDVCDVTPPVIVK